MFLRNCWNVSHEALEIPEYHLLEAMIHVTLMQSFSGNLKCLFLLFSTNLNFVCFIFLDVLICVLITQGSMYI